jgi:hypothetical protein
MQFRFTGNNFDPDDLMQGHSMRWVPAQDQVMVSRTTDSSEAIDRRTSRSICDAVGERLQQSLRPEPSRLSPHLQHLMEELYRQDREEPQTPH